jgi:hypothetical protein
MVVVCFDLAYAWRIEALKFLGKMGSSSFGAKFPTIHSESDFEAVSKFVGLVEI